MSQPDSDLSDAPAGHRTTTETRIDAAHVLSKAEAEPSTVSAQPAPEVEVAAGEAQGSASPAQKFRIQAVQLAEYLRRRQKHLDHRESQLHAQIAQLEGEARAARMSFNERVAELEERERELEARLARAQEKAENAPENRREQTEATLRHQKQKIDAHREASWQLVRQMLSGVERRRQAVEAEAARLLEQARQPSADLLRREEEVRKAARTLQARHQQLDETEAVLSDAQAEAERLRRQLIADRRKVKEQARAERQRMAAHWRSALVELDKRRQSLARASERVDHSRAGLEKLRSELGLIHRETLEIRLATEELWAQLSGSAPPEVLTRSLGEARAKLAEHYRTANAQLAERKEELKMLRSQLAEEHRKLVRQKEAFEQEAARRQQDLEQQAQRLVAREEELERQEAVFDDLAREWQAKQLGYQQEIRRLKARLGKPDAALASA